MTFPLKEVQRETEISFGFRTSLSNSLLLLITGDTDYCLICLEDGYLKVTFSIDSSETESLFSNSIKLNNLVWHHIYISKNMSYVTTSIDNEHIMRYPF